MRQYIVNALFYTVMMAMVRDSFLVSDGAAWETLPRYRNLPLKV